MRVPASPGPRRRRAIGGILAILVLTLSGGVVSGCADGDRGAATPTPAPAATVPTYAPAADAAAIEAAWASRPDYVRHGHPMVEEAYRYALERPDVIQWMPCYCGCGAMEHRSNLDCFFRSRMTGGAVAFEEHASYCDICIETALLAKRRMAEGRSLAEIRAEVDATWGGNGVPGTDTALPQG